MRLERLFRSGDQRGMIGEPEVIICAHVQHAFASGDRNVRILWTRNDSLGLEKTLRLNVFERLRKLFFEFRDHK